MKRTRFFLVVGGEGMCNRGTNGMFTPKDDDEETKKKKKLAAAMKR